MNPRTSTLTDAEFTLAQWGQQAAGALRALNHLTHPGQGVITDPVQVADLVATLATTTGRLPQLLGQLGSWLHDQACHGRLRIDACSPHTGVVGALDAAVDDLTRACTSAQATCLALEAAGQTLAHLATALPADGAVAVEVDDELEPS